MNNRPNITGRPGFTLIELIIAVSLLIMIMVAVGFIFGITGGAISESQAVNEMNASLADFYNVLRADVSGAERDGWMILGKREMPGDSGVKIYGNHRRQERELEEDTRCDWMVLVTSTELPSAVDSRLVGQWNRILYSHGRKANPTHSEFSKYTTEWVMVRHQLMTIWSMPFPWQELQTVQPGVWGMNEQLTAAYYGAGIDAGGDQAGGMRRAMRNIDSYGNRDFRWHWYGASGGYNWNGSVLTPTYDFLQSPARAVYEPEYWQDYVYGTYGGSARNQFGALPHCAEFRVQFALANDLRAGAGGSVRWRDPPGVGQGGYADPNFRAGDPLHKYATLPTSGEDSGRLSFGPGDDWPVLLKVTVRVYDPEERIEQGKNIVEIIPVAR